MSVLIRDPALDALAEEVRRLTGVATKTEAVRRALEAQVASLRRVRPITERLARAKAMADELGPFDRSVDMKAVMDEMWGE